VNLHGPSERWAFCKGIIPGTADFHATLQGAISRVAGVFLGVLYYGLDHVWPGSVAVIGEGASPPVSLSKGIYFSFITLATVGYGDLVPGNDIVRGLAIVEAIAGQFYLAVMIARLMSLYMRETR
jgi:hypothetical protein